LLHNCMLYEVFDQLKLTDSWIIYMMHGYLVNAGTVGLS
jgi:hypothetical protein